MVLLMVVVLAVSFTLAGWWTLHDQQQAVIHETRARGEDLATLMARNMAPLVIGYDYQAIKLALAEYGKLPDIAYARVVSARAVSTGEFDAGILKDTTAREWEKKGLRVIHTSAPLPPYVIAVHANLDEKSVATLRQALLALRKTDASHLTILKALDPEYDGFAPTSDAEYVVVRDLIAPFQTSVAEKPAAAKP